MQRINSFFKSFFWIPALISLIVYFQVLHFGSAWGDDQILIEPYCRDLRLVLRNFYHNIPGLHFFPFQFLQCYLINLIFGKSAFPFGFHLYQLFLHAFLCVLITVVLFKITNNKLISILIVSLWTVHPLNVETITRIGCAPGQIAASAFCMIFLYSFLKLRETTNNLFKVALLIVGIFFFLASLTSYEQYLFFPFVLFLIFYFLDGKKPLVLPLLLIYPVYLGWKYFANEGTIFASSELIKWTELGSLQDIIFRTFWLAPQLIVHYFKLFFWPDFLSESRADWYMVGDSIFSPYSLFCQLFVFALIVVSVFLYKKIPLFSIGMVWFFTSMILVIQIIPLYSIIDEHYCYLAIIGILLSIFSLVNYLFKKISSKKIILFLLPIFLILLWRTELYIPSSKDLLSQAIYQANGAVAWLKPRFIANALFIAESEGRKNELPNWLNEKAFEDEIIKWLDKNLNVNPDLSYKYGPHQVFRHYKLYNGIFNYLYFKGASKELNILINQAIRVKSDYIGYYQVACFLSDIGKWDLAWQFLKKAITLNPKSNVLYAEPFIEIAIRANKLSEAESFLRNLIQLNPKSSYPYLFCGWFYDSFGKKDISLDFYKQAILKDKIVSVNYKNLYFKAVDMFLKNKMLDMAKRSLNIILDFDPFDEDAKHKSREIEVK